MTDEIWRTDCRRLRSSRAAQRLGSTVSLRRCFSPEARIRQPSESDNRYSNNRRKPCCFFRRLLARTALLHRCGKESRLIARPIQPRRVRRRRSRANSIVRSHKRQRARSRAIVRVLRQAFAHSRGSFQELVDLSYCIMRLAQGTGQHSGFMKPTVPQPAQSAGTRRSAPSSSPCVTDADLVVRLNQPLPSLVLQTRWIFTLRHGKGRTLSNGSHH